MLELIEIFSVLWFFTLQRIYKVGDFQNTSLTPDKEINNSIY